MNRQQHQSAFTLIELMNVVAVLAILASIAYPSYQWAVIKGKRAQGRTAILELLQQQERYMTQNNTYLVFSNTAGTTDPVSVPFKTFAGDNSTDTPYHLAAEACTTNGRAECIRIIATPTFTDSEVTTLSATSSGAKGCSGTAETKPKVCWP